MRVFYLICLITIKKRLKPYKLFIYTNICFELILHISDKKDEVLKSAEKTKKALTRVNINNILYQKKGSTKNL